MRQGKGEKERERERIERERERLFDVQFRIFKVVVSEGVSQLTWNRRFCLEIIRKTKMDSFLFSGTGQCSSPGI